MSDRLDSVVDLVRNYEGVRRKRPIKEVVERLSRTHSFGSMLPNYGDDAAVIPWGDEYLLVAADGMMTSLLVNEPYAAGKASVMVTVNDIYSMGGRPIGMVNVLASGDDTQRRLIVEGIEKGCRKLQVPMLGGHLHPDSPVDCPALSVTIIGRAKKLLRSHLAAAGDRLVLAVDLDGRAGCRSVVSWDANSGKSPEALRCRLEALPLVAESGAAFAAKDVSNAGILGTAAIMLENSGKGADIDLDAIPRPDSLTLEQWLLCFQSFGFILSVPPENIDKVCSIFSKRGITAALIGSVQERTVVDIHKGDSSATRFDFSQDVITGISCSREKPFSKSLRS
ncbi:MAG: AIR synthase related protein [Desulfobacterales bacterium]